MIASPNFGFLAAQDPQLVRLGAQAERYFRDDPSTALFKVRQFAEFLAKLVAAHHGEYGGERETFEELLRRLSLDRILPRETADVQRPPPPPLPASTSSRSSLAALLVSSRRSRRSRLSRAASSA